MSTLNYKLLKEDNYDNLSKRFGTTLLANAGIFGDEDLTPGSTLSFTNLKDDEIKLILDRTQQYLNLVNRNRELSYIKENRDYIDRENFWQGNNSQGKSDEELLSTYKGTVAAAKQEEKDRAVQAEKSRIATQRSREQAEHVARLRSQGVLNEETMRFSPEMRYHEGRKQLMESTGNTHNPMLRGVTLNGNTDTSFEGSLQNFEDQAKLGEEIKDMTQKAATGVVGLAGATALAPMLGGSFVNLLISGTVADVSTRKGLDVIGVDKNSYLYKTLPLFTSILAGNLTKSVPEFLTLKSAVKLSPEYAKEMIKKGVSSSAQSANNMKELVSQELLTSGLSALPAYPISRGLQGLGMNEVASDVIASGLGGIWGSANANRAYHLTTGTGGQIGIKNVVKNYLSNGRTSQELNLLNGLQKAWIGTKQVGKGLWNIMVPFKNWNHGGYSGVYETDLGATSSRVGDMVRRAPKGTTGPVDAAYKTNITPTGTHNLGDYMGGQDVESLPLILQLHQALKPIYGNRVGGNKMMTMFSNMPEEEATKILKGMTVNVDGSDVPLVVNGKIDAGTLKHALRYNADVKIPYIKSPKGGYVPYKSLKFVLNESGEYVPVRRILGRDFARTGKFKIQKINTDVTSKDAQVTKLFGLDENNQFTELKKYGTIKASTDVPTTNLGIPYKSYGTNTTVGDTYLRMNEKGVPVQAALATDIRGHVDIDGMYNGNPISISMDPYGTGSGGKTLLGRTIAGFLDNNMKRTPISVNFNSGSNVFGKTNGTKIVMPLDLTPKYIVGDVDNYYQAYIASQNNPIPYGRASITRTVGNSKHVYNPKDDVKLLSYKDIIDRLTSHKQGGIIGFNTIGL